MNPWSKLNKLPGFFSDKYNIKLQLLKCQLPLQQYSNGDIPFASSQLVSCVWQHRAVGQQLNQTDSLAIGYSSSVQQYMAKYLYGHPVMVQVCVWLYIQELRTICMNFTPTVYNYTTTVQLVQLRHTWLMEQTCITDSNT